MQSRRGEVENLLVMNCSLSVLRRRAAEFRAETVAHLCGLRAQVSALADQKDVVEVQVGRILRARMAASNLLTRLGAFCTVDVLVRNTQRKHLYRDILSMAPKMLKDTLSLQCDLTPESAALLKWFQKIDRVWRRGLVFPREALLITGKESEGECLNIMESLLCAPPRVLCFVSLLDFFTSFAPSLFAAVIEHTKSLPPEQRMDYFWIMSLMLRSIESKALYRDFIAAEALPLLVETSALCAHTENGKKLEAAQAQWKETLERTATEDQEEKRLEAPVLSCMAPEFWLDGGNDYEDPLTNIMESKSRSEQIHTNSRSAKKVVVEITLWDVPVETVLACPELLSERDEKAVELIVSATAVSCGVCGVRKQPQAMKLHTDWHFLMNTMEVKGDEIENRGWNLNTRAWIRKPLFIDCITPTPDMETESAYKVPADSPTRCCPVCGEAFQSYWNNEEEEWMFSGAVTVPTEDKRFVDDWRDSYNDAAKKDLVLAEKDKVDQKYYGHVLHLRCYQGEYEGIGMLLSSKQVSDSEEKNPGSPYVAPKQEPDFNDSPLYSSPPFSFSPSSYYQSSSSSSSCISSTSPFSLPSHLCNSSSSFSSPLSSYKRVKLEVGQVLSSRSKSFCFFAKPTD